MGISIAREIYQFKMSDFITDLKGVVCYMEDVIIWGAS